jgi:hypothetical protein
VKRLCSALPAVAMLSLLAACGGGGDGGNSGFIPPTSDFAAQQAWKNLIGSGGSWTVSGTSPAGNVEETLAIAAAGTATFPPTGVSYSKTTITSTLKVNGTSQGSSVVEYFRDAGFLIQGVRSGTLCGDATSNALPAVAAKVNASGPLVTLNERTSCAQGAPSNGSEVSSWSIAFDRSFVFLCLNSDSRDATGQTTSRQQDCVEINEAGTLGTRARIVIDLPGNPTVTLLNY